jgi:hypothetical protein
MTPSTLKPERSGVYRTPADTDSMRGLPGMRWVDISVGADAGKDSLMRSFADALALPHTFGANWDALADALQDLPWEGVDAYVLHLCIAGDAAAALDAAWPTLLEVLATTATYWRNRRKSFVAFVDHAARLPQWV